MADHEDIVVAAALVQKALKLAEIGAGFEGLGVEDLGFVAHFRADQLGGLQAALERAGDDEIETDFKTAENGGKLQAVPFAVLVQRAFDVELGVEAAGAGAGVAH